MQNSEDFRVHLVCFVRSSTCEWIIKFVSIFAVEKKREKHGTKFVRWKPETRNSRPESNAFTCSLQPASLNADKRIDWRAGGSGKKLLTLFNYDFVPFIQWTSLYQAEKFSLKWFGKRVELEIPYFGEKFQFHSTKMGWNFGWRIRICCIERTPIQCLPLTFGMFPLTRYGRLKATDAYCKLFVTKMRERTLTIEQSNFCKQARSWALNCEWKRRNENKLKLHFKQINTSLCYVACAQSSRYNAGPAMPNQRTASKRKLSKVVRVQMQIFPFRAHFLFIYFCANGINARVRPFVLALVRVYVFGLAGVPCPL